MDAHILALETSSNLCELTLLSRTQAGISLVELSHEGTGDHAERLLPMAEQLLEQAGLDRHALTAIAFGQGPGGFTGLRVACGVAQGMAFALDLPVLPVSSLLAAAACGTPVEGTAYVVAQDARMQEVYAAVYCWTSEKSWSVLQSPVLLDAAQVTTWIARLQAEGLIAEQQPIQVVGDALEQFPDLAPAIVAQGWEVGQTWRATGASVAHLALHDLDEGRGISPDLAMPLYVREKVAYTIQEREQGLGGNPAALDQPLQIEAMQAGHVSAVLDIERRVESHPWTAGNFTDALGNSAYCSRIIHKQGQVQGYAVWLQAPDMIELLLIGVAPEQQRRGLARQLLDDGLQWARQHQLERVVLEVRASNAPAIGLYQRYGFKADGLRKNYYPLGDGQREDAVLMSLSLASKAGA
ncbi:acetyltransferase [Alcaligenes faecalis]|uniref:bifunctional tRNA (adenosine(37)-N6)-threonylcarbamoyltransferase complex dimerization subunit type 1 TsaB/ribosomal protein alanine acetyltransferase RimI n=1 Tax=Alcaligenes faecalis TaxID=511 RepID=UPI00052D1101|nr:bifunctional tRNA (adenosine(37)-N6)-threonylcarbamoyltransferase complex dimerization subunit type 1 TsaB/ribosomal protein alanine acetyltransferase RimI [Alcaligenes faecalis]KGP00620.1 acetyltransferase [Alcaligenes faecalis]